MKGPLEGVRILEWATWHQGASGAGIMLGDLGAQVIKIEEPGIGDTLRGVRELFGAGGLLPGGKNIFFEASNRNKQSITLNLREERGRQVLYRLVEQCDVFTTNFRPGVCQRLKLDYPTLKQYNPRLIYVGTSGYGSQGPYRDQRAYDWIGLAHSGMMTVMGERGMPPLTIVGMVIDQMGAMVAAYATLAALAARDRWGVGQEVHTSMLGSAIWLQYINVTACLLRGRSMRRSQRSSTTNPLANYYRCADGKWLMVCHPQSDRFWHPFCQALGLESLEADPRFATTDARRENREELIRLLDQAFASRPRREWLEVLERHDLIFSPVNEIEDLPQDPQVLANGFFADFDHPTLGPIKVVAPPLEMSATPATVRSPAPELGQHTEQVLLELGGYTWDDIARLKEEGII